MKTVNVDAKALRSVLNALIGPAHHIRELITIQNLPGDESDINKLVRQFNKAVETNNKDVKIIEENELGVKLLDFLRDINKQEGTPESDDVDDLLVLFSQYTQPLTNGERNE